MQNLQTNSNMILIEHLFQQMTQQLQQDRLEIRKDIMFMCQYMNILTERQDQHWQQIHFHHDQVMGEIRHHFQALNSFLTSSANYHENATGTFPLQQNEQLNHDFTVPVLQEENELLISDEHFGSTIHQVSVGEQSVLSFGSQDVASSNHVTVGVKASHSETLEEQNQVISEYKINGQDRQFFQKQSLEGQCPDPQTLQQISKQLSGQNEALGIKNRPLAMNELNVQVLNIRKWSEEPQRELSYNFDIKESENGDAGLDIQRSEQRVKMDAVDEQETQISLADEHKMQTKHIDEQNSKIRYDDEYVHIRHLKEEKLQTRHANEQKAQERQTDEQRVQTRHLSEQKVQKRHVDTQNEKNQDKHELDYRSQFYTQPENMCGNSNSGSEEHEHFMGQKPSAKKYADAVIGYTSDNSKMKSSPGQVNENPLLFTDTPDLFKTEGSFEGTGLYAESISKLYNDNAQSPTNFAKSSGSINNQTYKSMTKKNYKSETSDSKVFNRNTYKVSSTDTKDNRKKTQNKFH